MMTTRIDRKHEVAAVKTVREKPTRPEQLARLLNRKSGASIVQIQKAFGWQPHTARAAISTLRKAGTVIERSDTDKGAVYRIAGEG
jgi:Fic family protein